MSRNWHTQKPNAALKTKMEKSKSQKTRWKSGQPSKQLFPKRWPLSNLNGTKNYMNIPSSLLLTVLRLWCWCNSYLMLYGVGVSCRILYSIVSYLYVSCSGLVTSFGEEIANLSPIVYFMYKNDMEGPGSATIKQRSPSQAHTGRGNPSIRNHIIASKR